MPSTPRALSATLLLGLAQRAGERVRARLMELRSSGASPGQRQRRPGPALSKGDHIATRALRDRWETLLALKRLRREPDVEYAFANYRVSALGGGADGFHGTHISGTVAAAVDTQRALAPYSNTGNTIDVAAPGGNNSVDLTGDGYPDGLLSTEAAGDGGSPAHVYKFLNGTPMAAPHVAGVLALMKSINPDLSPAGGEACGAWLTTDQPILLTLERNRQGLDFPVEYQVSLPTVSNAAQRDTRDGHARQRRFGQ